MTGPEMTALALYETIKRLDDERQWCRAEYWFTQLEPDDWHWLWDEIDDITNDLRRKLAAHESTFRVRAVDIVERLT